MMKNTSFDYVYRDELDQRKIADVSGIEITPDIVFMVSVDGRHYTCIVDHLMSEEWHINFYCDSSDNYCAELSTLDDVFWNADSIADVIDDYSVASAIAQALADIDLRFLGNF